MYRSTVCLCSAGWFYNLGQAQLIFTVVLDVPAVGFTQGAPLPTPPRNLCHHPFFSVPSSILQLADEVLWACLAFVKSRWEGAGRVAGGDPAGAGLRLSGQARALREAEDA